MRILFALSFIISNNLNFKAGYSERSSEYSDYIRLDNENLMRSAVSEKIHIDNNWTAAKAAGICIGNGTYSDPYIIKDLEIDGRGRGNCIWIQNSDVYFIIENCTVYNSGLHHYSGILMYNVIKGQIINNTCSNNRNYGISLNYSNNNTISGNIANYNDYGIDLWFSNNNNVTGNISNNNYFLGIYSGYSYNNSVTGNIANSNYVYGINLDRNSNNNVVSGNTANYNDIGINLDRDSNNNVLSGNTANGNNYWGIYLRYSDNNSILENTANNNSRYGIYLWYSNFNSISGNNLIGNGECIGELGCEGNTFSDNGDCTYGQENDEGFPIELIISISSISGGALIVVATLILIKLKRRSL